MKSATDSGLSAAGPPAITMGHALPPVDRAQRYPPEIEHGEKVRVEQLVPEGESDHVEPVERA